MKCIEIYFYCIDTQITYSLSCRHKKFVLVHFVVTSLAHSQQLPSHNRDRERAAEAAAPQYTRNQNNKKTTSKLFFFFRIEKTTTVEMKRQRRRHRKRLLTYDANHAHAYHILSVFMYNLSGSTATIHPSIQ